MWKYLWRFRMRSGAELTAENGESSFSSRGFINAEQHPSFSNSLQVKRMEFKSCRNVNDVMVKVRDNKTRPDPHHTYLYSSAFWRTADQHCRTPLNTHDGKIRKEFFSSFTYDKTHCSWRVHFTPAVWTPSLREGLNTAGACGHREIIHHAVV